MKTAVLLSGCGVFDGSEIHESVLAFLSLSQNNLDFVCTAPETDHYHIINHLTGDETLEKRNVLVESSRLSRGEITPLSALNLNNVSSLVIPGGFGSAKNLSDWAFKGPNGDVLIEVKNLILHCIKNKKPIVSLCFSPTVIAKSLEGSSYQAKISVGNLSDPSEYNIKEINEGISALGCNPENSSLSEILYDEDLKIICAPCYMMKGEINQIYSNIKSAIDKLKEIL